MRLLSPHSVNKCVTVIKCKNWSSLHFQPSPFIYCQSVLRCLVSLNNNSNINNNNNEL